MWDPEWERSQILYRSFLRRIFGSFDNLSAVFPDKLPPPSKSMEIEIHTTSVAGYIINYLAEVKQILSEKLYFKVQKSLQLNLHNM